MPVKELRMQLLGDLERFCKGGREKMDKSTKYLIIGAGISGLTFNLLLQIILKKTI